MLLARVQLDRNPAADASIHTLIDGFKTLRRKILREIHDRFISSAILIGSVNASVCHLMISFV